MGDTGRAEAPQGEPDLVVVKGRPFDTSVSPDQVQTTARMPFVELAPPPDAAIGKVPSSR